MFLKDFIILKKASHGCPTYVSDVETWTLLCKLNGFDSEDGDSSVQ